VIKSDHHQTKISATRRGGPRADSAAVPGRDEKRRRHCRGRALAGTPRGDGDRAGRFLFGLYQGTPLPERSWGYGNALPDRISIYQQPIEEACADDEEIRGCVAETVIHEFGHYFGMDEDQIEEIEEKYWRGEGLDDV